MASPTMSGTSNISDSGFIPGNPSSEHGETRFHYSQLLLHINCQRCHHFHIAENLELPRPNEHLRFTCRCCHHPLFGIGHNSTQTSLASVCTSLTLDQDEGPPEENSGDDPICTNVPEELTRTAGDINAGSDPGNAQPHEEDLSSNEPSRTSLAAQVGRDDDASDESVGLGNQSSTKRTLQRAERGYGNSKDGSNTRTKRLLKQMKDSLRSRLPRYSGGLLTPKLSHPSTPGKPPTSTQDASTMTEHHSSTITWSARDGQGIPFSIPREELNVPVIQVEQILPDHPVVEHGPRRTPDEPTADVSSPSAQKRQRIAALRKEKTLHKRALQRRRCLCNDDCHCRRGPMTSSRRSPASEVHSNHHNRHSDAGSVLPQPRAFIPSDHQSESRSTSRSRPSGQPVVDDHQRRTLFRFVGTHLDPSHQSSSPRTSSIRLEEPRGSHQSTSTGISQATTLVSRRGSGARQGRLQPQRTHSLPSIALHDTTSFMEQARPEAFEAIRRHDEAFLQPPRSQRRTSQVDATDFASHPRRSVEQSLSSVSENENASSTSLSHLETVGNEDREAEEGASPNDPNPASLTFEESGDTRTPQAASSVAGGQRSFSSPPGESSSDEMIHALQQLEGKGEQNEAQS